MFETIEYLMFTGVPAFFMAPLRILLGSPLHSLLTIIISTMFGALAFIIVHKINRSVAIIIGCGATAVATFTVRFWIALKINDGGFSAPNFFTMQHPDNWVYLWFLMSGLIAGIVALYKFRLNKLSLVTLMLGISLGVLAHIDIASGYWTRPMGPRIVLFTIEAFAPLIFGMAAAFITNIFYRPE